MMPNEPYPTGDPIAAASRSPRSLAPTPLLASILLSMLLLASCASVAPPQPGARSMIDDRLYFGRTIPAGGSVSDAEWERFVEEVILHHLPDGHTVWRAEGAWRDASGAVIREPSFVLELIHADDRALDAAIDAIIAAYKSRFRQESVLWVRGAVMVRF